MVSCAPWPSDVIISIAYKFREKYILIHHTCSIVLDSSVRGVSGILFNSHHVSCELTIKSSTVLFNTASNCVCTCAVKASAVGNESKTVKIVQEIIRNFYQITLIFCRNSKESFLFLVCRCIPRKSGQGHLDWRYWFLSTCHGKKIAFFVLLPYDHHATVYISSVQPECLTGPKITSLSKRRPHIEWCISSGATSSLSQWENLPEEAR